MRGYSSRYLGKAKASTPDCTDLSEFPPKRRNLMVPVDLWQERDHKPQSSSLPSHRSPLLSVKALDARPALFFHLGHVVRR